MADPFTDDWFSAASLALVDHDPVGDASGEIHYIVQGVAGSKVNAQVVVDAGRVTTVTGGKPSNPTCVVTVDSSDALDIMRGTTSVEVAYMRGRLKVEGDHTWWLLDLRPLRAALAPVLAGLAAD